MHRRLLVTELTVNSATQSNGTRNFRDSNSSDASNNFDANMVIILAALLCALIGALGLNSIVRCAFRCSTRFSLESAQENAAKGLKKRDLRRIPVAVYGAGADIPATECPICLGEFIDGEKVRVLPKCNHGFHVRCIDTWLLSHSSCPNCRISLLENMAAAAAEERAGPRLPENNPGRQGNVVEGDS
ncbi:RING-H2 finger protein ATL74 [Mercurialis annua]|uniref:RING-H2 finger protein ATL74 n=1 Tax=Mercurialis annua TaxID=3986 RepID=UPI002160FADD|nr:RING-H2 finger protein ATL74 [Mercurialis annua]